MSDSQVIKPCPFCGSPPVLDYSEGDPDYTSCGNEACEIGSRLVEIKLWQERPGEDAAFDSGRLRGIKMAEDAYEICCTTAFERGRAAGLEEAKQTLRELGRTFCVDLQTTNAICAALDEATEGK